jgi:diketogulonate reductase-like aldo/keto reductase
LEAIYEEGRTRAIGVSNFLVHHLEDLLQDAATVPMVDQVEFHPRLQQPPLQDFCRDHGIQLEAWSPIMKGRVMDIPELQDIGEKYGKNPVQITLRWLLQKEIVAIPKSSHRERIVSNAAVYDFELSEDEMSRIDDLDQGIRVGPDPDNFNF